jgi:hypothetical protein
MKTIWSLLLLFFVPLCSIDPIVGEQPEEDQEEEEEFNEMDFYFYSEEPDASPIIEYMAPHEDWNETCPDFIYQPKQVPGIRIVEFYAHWWCVVYILLSFSSSSWTVPVWDVCLCLRV